jgi:hypothetical protein
MQSAGAKGVSCLALSALTLTAACRHLPADRNESVGAPIRNARVEEVPVQGASVVVRPRDGEKLRGELLAVSIQKIWLLDQETRKRIAIPWQEVRDVKVKGQFEGDLSPEAAIGLWTFLGVGASFSMGFLAFGAGPTWVLAGIPLAFTASGRDNVRFNGSTKLRAYARYPQGPIWLRSSPTRDRESEPPGRRPRGLGAGAKATGSPEVQGTEASAAQD